MTTALEESVSTIHFTKEVEIAAPLAIAFEAVLDELGPESEMPTEDGTGSRPFPMKLEPWPGGRWFRDLGNSTGHLWGHTQVIKPPTLLELSGPMFMSYPATNFVQYRLTSIDPDRTRLTLTHRALGLIPAEDREGVAMGWSYGLNRIIELAQRKMAARR
jgi:uncharacterized protein YndB with AHSA1/START domain